MDLPNDYEVEGQMNIFDIYYPEVKGKQLIAVSKVFARAIKQMNLTEWKTFIYALTFLDFTKTNEDTVTLDKKILSELLEIGGDPDNRAMIIKRSLGQLREHSSIVIDDVDRDFYESGAFIRRVTCYKNIVKIVFDNYYFPLFTELTGTNKPYITMWASDLFNCTSVRSILFYEDLRLHSDTRKTNERIYGIKDFKEMFDIPKDGKGSYMKKDGHFDRPAFEKYVIQPLCEDLKECQMVNLHLNPDGKHWEKIKNIHGNVIGYKFTWDVSDRPHIASAEELPKLTEELMKDPKMLKIAKNISDGKEKPKPQKNAFNEYKQNDYDYRELESKLIRN